MSVDPAVQPAATDATVEPQFRAVPKPEDFQAPEDRIGGDTTAAAPVRKTPLPTRKLSYAAVSAAVLYVLSLFIHTGDQQLEQLVNVVVPVVLAYFVPNADTPGGVPVAD